MYFLVKDHFLNWHCFFTILNYINICAVRLWYGNDIGNSRSSLMIFGGLGCQYMLSSVPVMARYDKCMVDQNCHISSLNHITSILIIPCTVATVLSSQQPEVTWPGRV